jgi:hypothetical protein
MIVRLKDKWSQEYEAWSRRDLSEKHFDYFWADGIQVNVRGRRWRQDARFLHGIVAGPIRSRQLRNRQSG